MARMNWNRPNNGYEREPWQRAWEPRRDKPLKLRKYAQPKHKPSGPQMTEEQRRRIQALRSK
jgi:hypothetical protein